MRIGMLVLAAWSIACFRVIAVEQQVNEPVRVSFDQKLNDTVSLDATFRDETGATKRLGSFLGRRPAVLVLAYYRCPNLCTVVLNGVVQTARDLRLTIGKEFDVVVVSIDPKEQPQLAAEKKRAYSRRYGRAGTEDGWHFLTGSSESISKVAASVGFNFYYDPMSEQYAHPSGIVVLTPAGRISRYFLGIEYPARELQLSLVEAAGENIGTLSENLLLLCFHYDPKVGRYTIWISRILQVSCIGTVILMGSVIGMLVRGKKRADAQKAGIR